MTVLDLPFLISAVIAGFSVLGGVMAIRSGFAASQGLAARESREQLAFMVNQGIGEGFDMGAPLAVFAFIVFLVL